MTREVFFQYRLLKVVDTCTRAEVVFMRNQDPGRPSEHKESMLHEGKEIDYSPKTYNRGETLLFGMKLSGIAALFHPVWIAEKYIHHL